MRRAQTVCQKCLLMQAFFSVIIFVLLSSQDGFSTSTGPDGRKPALYNGIFSTIAFLVSLFKVLTEDGWIEPKSAAEVAMYTEKRWTAIGSRFPFIHKPVIRRYI